jgi:hypothetical protein
MAALRIVPSGFAIPLPAMSGAEPWIGSYSACPVAQRCAGEEPQRARQHRRFVGQDVAEHVLGDDHVEGLRGGHEAHRARIDELVLDADARRLGRYLVRDLSPEARRLEHVGLVDRGDELATRGGQAHRETDDAADLLVVVLKRIDGACALADLLAEARLSEVQPSRQLAHEENVDPFHALGLERRARHERRVNAYRT